MNKMIISDLLVVNKNLIIPSYIVKYYSKLDLHDLEFIFLIYLLNQKDNIVFDINKISKDINQDSNIVLELINSLNEKNFLSIEMKKNNGIIEEYISLDLFYNKISSFMIYDNKKEKNDDIYQLFEKEFGRTLSPTEYEIIYGWRENNFSDELIKAALKESILSGVNNLRYIDKILFEWNKKGYKEITDIKNKNKIKNDNFEEEIYDYDWINE